jgi:hypothetical protein
MVKDSDGMLMGEAATAYDSAQKKIRRDYRTIEEHGWASKLRWWGDSGRPRLLTDEEAKQQCDQLHEAGFDVDRKDWEDVLLVQKRAHALATGTEDANCVKPVCTKTANAYMRMQDMRSDAGRTVTGTTSSESQTQVRQDAGQSIRAVVCFAATALYTGYNPIDAEHPRYKEHAKTMSDTDRLVEAVAKQTMLPVDNHLLTSTDATTTFVHLNTAPSSSCDVAQRKASARKLPPQEVDESPVNMTTEEAAANAAAMQARLDAARAATPQSMLAPHSPAQNGTSAISALADRPTAAAPLKPCHGSKRNAHTEARRAKEAGEQANASGFKIKSMHSFVRSPHTQHADKHQYSV